MDPQALVEDVGLVDFESDLLLRVLHQVDHHQALVGQAVGDEQQVAAFRLLEEGRVGAAPVPGDECDVGAGGQFGLGGAAHREGLAVQFLDAGDVGQFGGDPEAGVDEVDAIALDAAFVGPLDLFGQAEDIEGYQLVPLDFGAQGRSVQRRQGDQQRDDPEAEREHGRCPVEKEGRAGSRTPA